MPCLLGTKAVHKLQHLHLSASPHPDVIDYRCTCMDNCNNSDQWRISSRDRLCTSANQHWMTHVLCPCLSVEGAMRRGQGSWEQQSNAWYLINDRLFSLHRPATGSGLRQLSFQVFYVCVPPCQLNLEVSHLLRQTTGVRAPWVPRLWSINCRLPHNRQMRDTEVP